MKQGGIPWQHCIIEGYHCIVHRGPVIAGLHDDRTVGLGAVQGVDKKYDEAEGRVKDAEADLAEYLQQIRRQLGAGKDLCYVTVNKDANLLEVPQVTLQHQEVHPMPSMVGYQVHVNKDADLLEVPHVTSQHQEVHLMPSMVGNQVHTKYCGCLSSQTHCAWSLRLHNTCTPLSCTAARASAQ